MTRIKYLIIFLFTLFFLFSSPVQAENKVNVYFFWGDGCPHCAKEKELLEYYQHKYSYVEVLDFELYNNFSNSKTLSSVTSILGTRVDGVPFTVIGDKSFSGYSETISPDQISERIEYCYNNNCPDSLAKLFEPESNNIVADNVIEEQTASNSNKIKDKKFINVPGLGEIDAVNFSLPLITIVMGVLDGFNPCALWTLLFLISLLLGMENKKKMWVLGSAFIIASASVYFLFMAAWLNFILFIGFIIWARLLIGGIAFLGGSYNLKEFLFNKNSGCKVTNDEKRQKVFTRLKQIIQQKSFWISFVGIILLAFAVNLVELVCSAGLPAVYTQILALNDLAGWQYYAYILLYIFFFMIDDLFIFFVAMTTLKMTGISTKYSRYSKLIGGVIMLIIGILLIFKPEWLMFG
ncbi:MAG: hypothetical protein WCX97_03375 [Candidatus Magasanikbacteria bacterium]